jgi:hypothetical protein
MTGGENKVHMKNLPFTRPRPRRSQFNFKEARDRSAPPTSAITCQSRFAAANIHNQCLLLPLRVTTSPSPSPSPSPTLHPTNSAFRTAMPSYLSLTYPIAQLQIQSRHEVHSSVILCLLPSHSHSNHVGT